MSQQFSLGSNVIPMAEEVVHFRKETGFYWNNKIQVVGDLLFEGSEDINVYNISDINNPVNVTTIGNATQRNYDFIIDGNYLYTNYWSQGTEIYDISDIYNVQLVYSSPVRNFGAYGYEIVGNLLFSNIGDHKIYVHNITDPTNPTVLDVADFYPSLNPFIYDVEVRGTFLYALWSKNSGEKGLVIFDVRDPTDITLVGGFNSSVTTPGTYAGTFAIQNNLAYIGITGYGLQVLDISNHENPELIGEYNATSYSGVIYHGTNDIEVFGSIVLTVGALYMSFIDVSDLQNIFEIGRIPVARSIKDAEFQGSKMYTANQNGGVTIYELGFNPVTETNTETTTETLPTTITEQASITATTFVTDTTIITETTEVTMQKSEANFNYIITTGIFAMCILTIVRSRKR